MADDESAKRTLARAFDSGITHFDVARLYGLGRAEAILGDFAKTRRESLTIATKVGLRPPAVFARNPGLVGLAKKILRRIPFATNFARRRLAAGPALAFDANGLEESFEMSLKALRTDSVDILLLHEATIDDARSHEVISFLERQRTRGTARTVGIGSNTNRFREGGDLPGLYEVVQFGHSAAFPGRDVIRSRQDRLCITHSVFEPLRALLAHAGSPRFVPPPGIGLDLTDESTVRSLLLHFALRENPNGTVLFSSTSEHHIAANANDAVTARYDDGQLNAFARYAAEVVTGGGGTRHDP